MAPALCTRRWRSLSDAAVVAAVGIALAISTAACKTETAHKPARIVSINICADKLVLRLADPRNVVSVLLSVSNYHSNVIDLVEKIPVNIAWRRRVLSHDYGFEQPLLNDKIRFGVTYYHNDITNLITTVSNLNGSFTYGSVGLATTSDFESFLQVNVVPG